MASPGDGGLDAATTAASSGSLWRLFDDHPPARVLQRVLMPEAPPHIVS